MMRRGATLLSLCLLCLLLAACGGSTASTLPDDAKRALDLYITEHYGGVSWRVQSAEQATDPGAYLYSSFPDDIWCVVVSPPLVDPNDPQQTQQDHFLVGRSGSEWDTLGPAVPPAKQYFAGLGCTNG
jgi:hypothetical protein